MSGDGQPIDAYLPGWDIPVLEAEGTVTAVIVRLNDLEDKLVVVPHGTEWTDEEILKITSFQEQYFQVRPVR